MMTSRQPNPNNAFIEFGDEELEQSIPERFEKQIEKYPDRLAVRWNGEELKYGELETAANRVSVAIVERIGPGNEPMGLLFDQCVSAVVSIIAALKAHKVYVPLNPSHPAERIHRVLEDCRPRLVVTNGKYASLARRCVPRDTAVLDVDSLDHTFRSRLQPRISALPDSPAYIFYTSGSTGRPKGVVDTHRGVLHNVMRYTNSLHICCDDRLTLLQSPSFSGSVSSLFGALLNGAAIFPFDVQNEGLSSLAEWLAHERITIYHSVPSIFRRVAGAGVPCPALRIIRLEGDQAQTSDVELYRKRCSRTCLLVNGLGATECGLVRQCFVDKTMQVTGTRLPVGYPVKDMEVLILDDDGRQLSAGTIGEIAVRSRHLTARYWQRPDLTRQAFLEETARPGSRTYRTGDLGRMRLDGCLELLCRKDFQMKVRGHRVEVTEIEAALLGYDALEEVVVQTHEGPDGEPRLVAYYVANGTQVPTVSALRRHLGDTLPEYMIPSAFLRLDCLPLTSDGKVNRKSLPAPLRYRPYLECTYVAPRCDAERRVAQIWQRLLDVDRIGVKDSFFELGGDSLLGVAFMEKASKVFGKEVPFSLLYNSPTVEGIARFLDGETLDGAGTEVTDSIFVLEKHGEHPPFFCIGGDRGYPFALLDLVARLGPEHPAYGMQLRGISDDREPFETIEDIALDLTDQILQIEPFGPYYLAGYSFGSFVAFEIARQLESRRKSFAQVT